MARRGRATRFMRRGALIEWHVAIQSCLLAAAKARNTERASIQNRFINSAAPSFLWRGPVMRLYGPAMAGAREREFRLDEHVEGYHSMILVGQARHSASCALTPPP